MVKKKIIVIVLVVFTILLSSFGLYFYQMFNTPNVLVDREDQIFYIPTDSGFSYVQRELHENDIVQDLVSFSFMARLKDYDKQVKAGRYRIKSDMTNGELINQLLLGLQEPTKITFNNIRTPQQLAGKITENIEIDSAVFANALLQPEVANDYGFDTIDFYTMFLPDTYEVYWNISTTSLIDKMYREHQKFWNDERLARADSIGLSPKEVTILASIVQAETLYDEESPKVAGVYMNRLRKNIALQADPTLIFALNDYSIKRVLNEHKTIDSPYNTYKYRGLPPGPINLPSKANLEAVLNYENHNFYYFCAKEDFSGYHAFASSLREHINNARRYQRALNKARIYR
jgi:UPF0755 protein